MIIIIIVTPLGYLEINEDATSQSWGKLSQVSRPFLPNRGTAFCWLHALTSDHGGEGWTAQQVYVLRPTLAAVVPLMSAMPGCGVVMATINFLRRLVML